MTNQTKHTKQLREEFEKLLPCINRDCDGNGTIPERDEQGDWQPAQCEFCFKIRFPVFEKIEKTLTSSEEELIEEMRNSFEQIAHDLIDNRDNSKGKDRLRFQAQLEIVKYLLTSLKRKDK